MTKSHKNDLQKMTNLIPHGPFTIPTEKVKRGKIIRHDVDKLFWRQKKELASLKSYCGCYIFAIRAGLGYVPWYVGKTARSFFHEIFNGENKFQYDQVLAKQGKGNPVIFFVSHPTDKKGPLNKKLIDNIESELIKQALSKNPELLNQHKTKPLKWRIDGFVRSGQGQPTREARELKRLFN
jgi:hypothetical protein